MLPPSIRPVSDLNAFAENRLWLRLPDLPEKPLFASSPKRFLSAQQKPEFEFGRDPSTNSPELVIHKAGGDTIYCPRT